MKAIQERKLAPFPDPWDLPERQLSMDDLVERLLRPDANGFLIHGGPGSGKSTLLNYLAEALAEDGRGRALGPIPMQLYRGQGLPDRLIRDVAEQIIFYAREYLPELPLLANGKEHSTHEVVSQVEMALAALHKAGVQRCILLLDNFEQSHPWSAVALANQIRLIFDKHKFYFGFALTAESDLEELRAKESTYSPMLNISESYLLLDYDRQQVARYAQETIEAAGKLSALQPAEQARLWQLTRGYPALVDELLAYLIRGRQNAPSYSLDDALAHCLRDYGRVEPLRTAVRKIDYLTNLDMKGNRPADLIDNLARRDISPDANDRAARMLLALGVFGWVRNYLTWRNEFMKIFWEEKAGALLASWLNRPVSYRESQLSGQGQIVVSLFMDMAPLLAPESEARFDLLRGSMEWIASLQNLPANLLDGPFQRWRDQERLNNIGYDLNIFQHNIVTHGFLPIYELDPHELDQSVFDLAQLLDALLGRFGVTLEDEKRRQAEAIIRQEWERLDQVRLQLTRGGAVHVTLIRDLLDPIPLLQILAELLGLEQELDISGESYLEMSVQWEIVLMVVQAFVQQISGAQFPHISQLGLTWREAPPEICPDGTLYPLRDRYVIYSMQKLCNCRNKMETNQTGQRSLITMADLMPVRDHEGRDWSTIEQPYNYGRELASLLEGVMLRGAGANSAEQSSFPILKPAEVSNFLRKDLSSWENELFVTSLDNALFVYQIKQKLRADSNSGSSAMLHDYCQFCGDYEARLIKDLYFPQRKSVDYEDYWQCLTLGLQYVVELRWGASWVAQRTTEDLNQMAELIGHSNEEIRQRGLIRGLTERLALSTRLLAHLRDAAIPNYMAGADYAARKYEDFIAVSGLRGTIANAEKNITAINDFIHHHEQQENLALQRREQQLNQAKEERERRAAEDYNDRFNRITLVIALIAIFGVIPSFWVDFGGDTNRTAISELLHLDAELSFIVLILISVIMMLFSVGWYYYEFHRRRK
ncbi:MAG: ATP-binding protein [Anaerolineales bacterium]|nr:ATP-binding protein [Anaerolineales bacterium]